MTWIVILRDPLRKTLRAVGTFPTREAATSWGTKQGVPFTAVLMERQT